MARSGLLFAWMVLAFAAGLLAAESLTPGQVLLPLLPDDFATWQQGTPPDDWQRHPHPNYTMSDVVHLLVPGLMTTQRALAEGGLPWWDPSQALGVPHVSQVHYAVFYPPAWIPLIFGIKGLGLLAWVHLMIAGGGMLLYLRALKRSTAAALTGALAFALSAWITARLQSFPAVGAAVWLPWVLWGLERGARYGRPRSYVAAAGALGLSFLAGFPQVTLLVASLAGGLEAVRFVAARDKRALRPLLLSAAAVGLGALIAAGQLLPTLEYMAADSARAEADPAGQAAECLEPPLLNHLIAPDYYSSVGFAGPNPMALGTVDQATLPAALNRAETSMGIGVLGLMLALLAMVFGRTWSTRVWTVVVLGVFGLLLMPELYVAVARWVPVLRFGSPKRLLLLSSAGLAVLCAGGVDLLSRDRMRVTVLGWILALGLLGWSVVLMLNVPSTETPEDVDGWALRLASVYGVQGARAEDVYALGLQPEHFALAAGDAFDAALLALAASVLGVILFRPRSARTQQGWTSLARMAPDALALVVAAELLVSAFPLLRGAPVRGLFPDSRTLELPEPALATAVKRVTGYELPLLPGGPPPGDTLDESLDGVLDGDLVPPRPSQEELDALAAVAPDMSPRTRGPEPARIARVGTEPAWIRPNLAGLWGLTDLQAYAPMAPRRTVELLAAIDPATAVSGSRIGGFGGGAALEHPMVDALGIEVVLTSDAAVQAAGFEPLDQVGQVRVLRNAEALPHVWFVVESLVSPPVDGAPGPWIDDPAFDPAVTVALEAELPQGPNGKGSLDLPLRPGAARSVELVSWEPGRLVVHVGPGAKGALVVGEAWHGDWVARFDGRDAPVVPADHALMAVSLAGGMSGELVLEYDPGRPLQGAALGTVGLLAAVALAAWSDLRRRAGRDATPGAGTPRQTPHAEDAS